MQAYQTVLITACKVHEIRDMGNMGMSRYNCFDMSSFPSFIMHEPLTPDNWTVTLYMDSAHGGR